MFTSQHSRVLELTQLKLALQANELLTFVEENLTLMKHLHIELNRSLGKLKKLAANLKTNNLHSTGANLVFHIVQDGLDMVLAQKKDL